MKRCLFTYKESGNEDYSLEGLKTLNSRLTSLKIFPYSKTEQDIEVQRYAGKISIQGVQPKLSAKLSVKNETFELVSVEGDFILKPQVDKFKELPQNEDLTMHLAQISGIKVPWHGLIKAKDNSLIYVVKRFDRLPRKRKLPQEDFAQLMGATRTTKYQASMERVAEIIEEFCTYPVLELEKLFKITLFAFLTGNEDMHLKNFSLQTDLKNIVKLTPAYDLVNSTIAMVEPKEEFALELNGKKHGFVRSDFIDYYASESCYIPKPRAEKILESFIKLIPEYQAWIQNSFLSEEMKRNYVNLVVERAKRLQP